MDMRIGVDMRISRSCAAHSAIAFARTIYASRTDASQRLVRTTTKEYQTAPQGLIGVRAVTPRMCVVSGWWCRARCAPRLRIVTVLPGRPEPSRAGARRRSGVGPAAVSGLRLAGDNSSNYTHDTGIRVAWVTTTSSSTNQHAARASPRQAQSGSAGMAPRGARAKI